MITGGAGGLGLAIARALVKEQVHVALWDLNGERLEAALSALRAEKVMAEGWVVDVTDPTAVREAAAKVGPVDVLFNNAGVHAPGDFLENSESDISRQIAVNLTSYIYVARAFLPGMISRGSGHLVWTASAAGLLGVPGMAVYSATKHAVVGLAESIRMELRRAGHGGIKTTIVCPSFIDTGMFNGCTPPAIAPWLKPDALAREIVSAVRADRLYVREPAMVKLIPLLKALPSSVGDLLCALTGMDRSLGGPPVEKRRVHRP
ncbi:MAG: SDR family NAD(P)-dependent oxidoreductase [Elusimicrobiota bacterium]|nr:MAG: SDR family NAD(P)-dependent oxidoreductase [Elusimicrobiota bacterium]